MKAAACSANGGADCQNRVIVIVLRAWHKEATVHTLGEERARTRTWHALRATLASAVAAYRDQENRPLENFEGVAQMLVRWKSVESLRIYLKVRDTAYADYVDIVTKTDGSQTRAEDLPPLGPEEAAADIAAAIEALTLESDRARGTGSKRRADGASEPAPQNAEAPAAAAKKAAPAAGGRAQARQAARAAAPEKGARIEVDFEGEWWRGAAGSTRWSEADGAFITRVAYDAARGWRAHSAWHVAGEFLWRRAS